MTRDTSPRRRPALFPVTAAALLLASWALTHWSELTAGPDLVLRFVLTGVFALLIALRPKPPVPTPAAHRTWPCLLLAAAGAALVGVGLVFRVRQAEWTGVLLLTGACLRAGLGPAAGPDALRALVLLYWAHPLPSALLGALQLTMQQVSVTGAEWILHALNIRVWADGMVLRTGYALYEVPAWCSGMRTATTVLLLTAGLGMLKRLPRPHLAAMLPAALLQAAALNALRIALMVLVVPHLRTRSAVAYLHDTAGVVVLAAVVLVYLELKALETLKRRRLQRAAELNPNLHRVAREIPFLLARAWDRRWLTLASLVGATALGLFLYRQRPSHRLEMYRGVAEALRDAGSLESAERLARRVAQAAPDDRAWQLATLRMLVMRGKYVEALAALRDLPPGAEPMQEHEERILSAYCFMGLKRLDEARQAVDGLPAALRNEDPRVSMILAELAFYADDADEVARRIGTASRWAPNLGRIRALYPYLRLYRRWDEIVASDPQLPFPNLEQALAAAEAYMNTDRDLDVATLALRAVDDWPEDPRLLVPLFYLAGKRPDDGWERRYAQHVQRCLPAMRQPDALYELADNCFKLGRPDLAWLAILRLRELGDAGPDIDMLGVHHGRGWFSFRKRLLGWPAATAWERVDLTPWVVAAKLAPPSAPLLLLVPDGAAFAAADHTPARRRRLDAAVAGYAAQAGTGGLTVPRTFRYAFALEIADRPDDALAAARPAQADAVRLAVSELQERQADWQGVYETLRTYPQTPRPALAPLLRLALAQMNLKLGLGAILNARHAADLYPRSTQAAALLGMVLSNYDSPEAALFVASAPRSRDERILDLLEAETLHRTQRYREFQRFTRAVQLTVPPLGLGLDQAYAVPPAELALYWPLVFLPSQAEFDTLAARMRENLPRTTSPFLRCLYTASLPAMENAEPALLSPGEWEACGRDPVERATALVQLGILLCRRERDDEARTVFRRAVELVPEACLAWRYLVGLTNGDPAVAREAAARCPRDAELWLAAIAARCRAGQDGAGDGWEASLETDARAAANGGLYPPAALTRAAELLLRTGRTAAAEPLARAATADARGFLPAYLVGLRCALAVRDRDWALGCTQLAIQAAVRPPPLFYRKLVELKARPEGLDIDDDMVEALKQLRQGEPQELLWAQLLAFVRFRRGGWEVLDSLEQATAALRAGDRSRTTYLVGAEAARLLHNHDRAVDILRRGLDVYPNDLALVNNLAFTLADQPATARAALDYVTPLLREAGRHPWIVDTLVVIYLRNGDPAEAARILSWNRKTLTPGTPEAFRHRLREAEILFQQERAAQAAALLRDELAGNPAAADEDLVSANRLLARIDEQLRQAGPRPPAPAP